MLRRAELDVIHGFTAAAKRKSLFRAMMAGGTIVAVVSTSSLTANCAEKDGKTENDAAAANKASKGAPPNNGKPLPIPSSLDTDAVAQMINASSPMLIELGFSGFMGACTGVAAKRIGNTVAAGIGSLFVLLQGLAYFDVIHINWRTIQDKATALVDSDGDGKITANDFVQWWEKFKGFLTFNLPNAGGFAAGLLLGVRYGR